MHTERLPWFAAAFGVTSTGPVSDSLAWDVSLVGVVPLLRHAFVAELDGARAAVFETPAAGALFGLGLRWELLGS